MIKPPEKTWLERGRISPRDVLTAYRTTNYEPSLFWVDGDTACALTAIAATKAAQADRPFMPQYCHEDEIADFIYDIVGLDRHYLESFIEGFDGEPGDGWDGKGWRDGRRAARFVFGERA